MRLLKVAVVVFWVVMTGWLVYAEALHGIIGYKQLSYLELIPKDLMLEDNWLGVYFRGAKIGYMHTFLNVPQGKKFNQFRIRNDTFLQLPILGRVEEVRFQADVLIDDGHRLKNFNLDLRSPHYSTRLTGQMKEEGDLELCIESQGMKRKMQVSLSEEAVLYSPFIPFPTGKLISGKKFSMRFFNPITLSEEKVFIEPQGTEEVSISGENITAVKLKIGYRGLENFAWITEEGKLLKEETPLGWSIIKEEADEILKFMKEKPKITQDLITSFSLPSNVKLSSPENLRFLKAVLSGYSLDVENLKSAGQRIKALEKEKITLSVNSSLPPEKPSSLPIKEEALLPFLKASLFVQSDDENIIKTARKIIGEEKNSWQAAILLNQWVYKNVKKVPTVSIPSSVDVLQQMQGDCNEHTFLYTALARSVGIPTKMVYGLLYQEGAFFYHAWVQVFVGRWVDLDPTLGEDLANATHIKLLEGELEDQMELIKIIGKLRIEVKDYR